MNNIDLSVRLIFSIVQTYWSLLGFNTWSNVYKFFCSASLIHSPSCWDGILDSFISSFWTVDCTVSFRHLNDSQQLKNDLYLKYSADPEEILKIKTDRFCLFKPYFGPSLRWGLFVTSGNKNYETFIGWHLSPDTQTALSLVERLHAK